MEVHRCSSWTRFSPCPLLCYECLGPVSALHSLAFPQLQFITVVDFLLRYRGLFPWSCCSADHRVSPVAPVHVVDVPRYAGCAFSLGGLQFLNTLTTCPLLLATGAWSWTVSNCRGFRSCSSLMVFDVSVVVRCSFLGPDCSDDH